jgi:uncharacterized membrane protein
MDDLNNPKISAYKPQRRWLPKPPGYRSKLSGAQRRQKAQAQARTNARATRLHLVGLTSAAVIVLGVIVAAMIVLLVVLMIAHGL